MLSIISVASAATIESGVSHKLAQQRKNTVSNVVYNLSLSIDSVSSINPEGNISIAFDYQPDNQPIQIDFAGEGVKKLVVNNHEITSPVWQDGHIVIAPDDLVSGRNTVAVEFTSAGRALNRNPGYMYTLFVPNRAHSVFPCFDQPDMKASYNLTLTVPSQWKAVSNSPVISSTENRTLRNRTIKFGSTEPLSTYLFAFAAGEFEYRQHAKDGRTIGAYYRETDPYRLEQLDEIFSQVESSLKQLEDYTGIPYPFAKYDLVILPGFQFGGMEHTGATFYNDNTIFLGKNATGAEQLSRAKLIAHETAHMWFGDYVTMEWFDDVWTKEVFANFFAARLTRELLPQFDHDLEWLRVYMSAALDQDRSDGSTPIRQQLDNLKNAGLIYNNIIYNKSPLMMGKLAEITGEENFKRGIRKYLSDNAYGNATWDDLISALAAYTDTDIEQFSRVWVYEPGMPEINFSINDGKLIVRQIDSRGRNIVWQQTFDVVVADGDKSETITVEFDGSGNTVEIPLTLHSDSLLILPAADGRAYGLLTIIPEHLLRIMKDALSREGNVSRLRPVGQLATLMMLNENYLAGNIEPRAWIDYLIKSIEQTTDGQMLSALTRYTGAALLDLTANEAAEFEQRLFELAETHPLKQGKTMVLRKLISTARSPRSIEALYKMWEQGESPLLGKDDFSDMALQLAIALPAKADSIIATQRRRIGSGDRLRKFDYVSRAAVSDTLALDSLFASLSDPANRLVEPWTLSVVSLLNHPVRHDRSVRYIIPALEMLPQIQATGDIFFPANWSASLLGSYRSKEATARVARFMEENKDMNPLL
ncbi:MAG: aminopeptidase, partial [Paramuribaculum sp.]|nr:aminopeptidase [Paramuribaculum sp.]